MQRIIDAYKLRTPMLDENGEAIYNPDGTPLLDDMTDAQKAEAAEEFLAFAAETYGVPIDEIYADNRAKIDAWGREHGRDTHDWNEKRRMTREWMAETGFKPERPGWWKQLISQIRVWLAEHGFGHLREADIETIIQDAFKGANRTNRTNGANGETRFAAAIDEEGNYYPGPDAWGTAYTSMSGKGVDAVKFLLDKQNGWVPAAWHRKGIGDIDVVYGETNGNDADIEDEGGWGIAHIDKKHNVDWDEVENIILNGVVLRRTKSRIILGKNGGKAAVKLVYDKFKRNWLVSAFGTSYGTKAEKNVPSSGILPNASGNQGATNQFGSEGLYNIGEVWPDVKQENEENDDKSRFSVSPVWTGSAADYEQPSLFYVGTGEGNQVYGWGLYGSDSRGVAEWYAENDAMEKATADVLLDGKASDVFLREMRNKNGETTRTAAGCAQHAEEAVNSGDDRVVLPSFSGILDDLAGEIITRLAQAVISADLGIDVVLVVSFPGNGTFRDQRFTSSGDEDLHFGLHGNTEFSGTVFILFVSGIIAEHRIRDADEADIQDAVGLLLGNDLEGVVALESGCDLRARKFGKERFARIVADRADGNRLDLRVHHGPHVIIAAGSAEENTAESKHTESQDRPEETGIRTLHRNRPFLHRIRGNPFSRLF